MYLDIYHSAARSKEREREVNENEFFDVTRSEHVKDCIAKYRAGDKEAKKKLPCWTPMGKSTTGYRKLEDMVPTGLVMLDIDHVKEGKMSELMECFNNINTLLCWHILLVHITPSGNGLRVIFSLPDDCKTIVEAQDKMVRELHLCNYGDYDGACKDLTRLSFFPQECDIKFRSDVLFMDYPEESQRIAESLTNESAPVATPKEVPTEVQQTDSEAKAKFADAKYGDIPLRDIVDAYINDKGAPVEGEHHNYYNNLVTNFRHICNNDPDVLVDVLPLFGQTREVRYSQCQSITRKNHATSIPKAFYLWLKDKEFLPYSEAMKKAEGTLDDDDDEETICEEYQMLKKMPELPPVFKQYVNSAPKDFKIPVIMSLLPILGTTSSYVQAEYPIGESIQTTTFITIIVAPSGQGKSFVKRYLCVDATASTKDNILHYPAIRDKASAARENIHNRSNIAKSANEKGCLPLDNSIRIVSPNISQPELLIKMENNHGYHMFMFAPEMDTFKKGMKAGGSDKNDMFRIAWDNDPYSQHFKTIDTFKGTVPLYLNVLITGTPNQIDSFFRDAENGLVARCSFTDLGDQEFKEYQPWKKLTKRDQAVIEKYKLRCETNTYTEPFNIDIKDLPRYRNAKDFDANVPWHYQFRERQTINLDYMKTPLIKWLNKHRVLAEKDFDHARDTFRKRSAVKAFRLALLCHTLYDHVGKKEQKVIRDFAMWFAELDLMKSMKQYGAEYNEIAEKQLAKTARKSCQYDYLFNALNTDFSSDEVSGLEKQNNLHTPVKNIIHLWKNAGLIIKTGKNMYKKIS